MRQVRRRQAVLGQSDILDGPLLALRDLHKRFGGIHALRGVSLEISAAGVVHGLIGENGSGKSTLLGIMSGQLQPDEGSIEVGGQRVWFPTPSSALAAGVAMVSQETSVAPDLSIAENIFLGHRLVRTAVGVNWGRTRAATEEILHRLKINRSPRTLVGLLRPDEQQMVEIARALSFGARVLILDEPTSSLAHDKVETLFTVVRELARTGVSTVFVSHRLDELMAISDELTVLRDGQRVGAGPIANFDVPSIVELMIGGKHTTRRRALTAKPAANGKPAVLRVENVAGIDGLHDVNLEVRAGEIVGLAGHLQAGRSELMETIFGIRRQQGGRLLLDGEEVHIRGPRDAVDRGLAYLPPDRKLRGVVLCRSLVENLMMVQTHGGRRMRSPDRRREAAEFARLSAKMRLHGAGGSTRVEQLSGGNQQKIAIGKWLVDRPRLLMLDEPTRGVDVRSKDEIHALLRDLADEGCALLVSSSENSELLELCDRILIMYKGTVLIDLPAAQSTESEIARIAGGQL